MIFLLPNFKQRELNIDCTQLSLIVVVQLRIPNGYTLGQVPTIHQSTLP